MSLTEEQKKNILKIPNNRTLIRWLKLKVPFHQWDEVIRYYEGFKRDKI